MIVARHALRWIVALGALASGCALGIDPNTLDGGGGGDDVNGGTDVSQLDTRRSDVPSTLDTHGGTDVHDTGTATDTHAGTDTGGGACTSGDARPCYTGTAATRSRGICHDGTQPCTGGTWSTTCPGQQLPAAAETCGNSLDDDCNGMVDDGCGVCSPGATQSCYDGPAGTMGLGACHPGTEACLASHAWSTSCSGEVTPTAEVCGNMADDNCNGSVDEGCVSSDPCSIYTDCYSCTGGATCGFCGSTGTCLSGTSGGSNDGSCGGFDWSWYSFDCP